MPVCSYFKNLQHISALPTPVLPCVWKFLLAVFSQSWSETHSARFPNDILVVVALAKRKHANALKTATQMPHIFHRNEFNGHGWSWWNVNLQIGRELAGNIVVWQLVSPSIFALVHRCENVAIPQSDSGGFAIDLSIHLASAMGLVKTRDAEQSMPHRWPAQAPKPVIGVDRSCQQKFRRAPRNIRPQRTSQLGQRRPN